MIDNELEISPDLCILSTRPNTSLALSLIFLLLVEGTSTRLRMRLFKRFEGLYEGSSRKIRL